MPNPDAPSLLDRLKRRKVVQWTVAYLSGAWLILQVVDVIGDQFAWPAALERGITIALGLGLLAAIILAWYHGEKGHQRVTGTETVLLGAVLLAGAGALIGLLRDPAIDAAGEAGRGGEAGAAEAGAIPVDPERVAVLPFAPATPDSGLERLGRDLAVTLSATLDGIADLRTVDALTILAHSPSDDEILTLPAGRALATRLGAGRVLRGSLTRQGDRIRVDMGLHGGSEEVLRTSAVAPASAGLAVLTDSLALTLLRRLWDRPSAELPSPAALGTRSAEALRAYVEGEEAMAAGEMAAAVAAFERAFTQDSTYWFAYWRSLYPRIYEGSEADPAIMAKVVEHRSEFPVADRLLVEAHMASTVRDRLAILERATQAYPTHWPAWFTLANLLVHWSPYLGTSYPAARAALERVVQLNPGLSGGWEHLFWIAVQQRDTATTAAVMETLESYVRPGGFRYDPDVLQYYGTTASLVVGGDSMAPQPLREVAAYLDGYAGPIPAHAFGVGLLIFGLPRGQVLVADAVLDRGPGAEMAASMWRGKAYGWAGRGAWDSAAVAIRRWTRAEGSWPAALAGYGLMVSGAALGAVDPEDAAAFRPPDAQDDAGTAQVAELAWLDGVLAFARRDPSGIAASRQRLQAAGDETLPLLDASLAALRLHAAGDPDAAVRTLLAAEDSAANHYQHSLYRYAHPHVSTVDRVLLGRWLREAGRLGDAVRVLTWNEAVLPGAPPLEVVNRTVGQLGLYERARAEEAMGRFNDAAVHYRRFLEIVDRPVEALRPLVEDARERVAALEPRLPG